MPQKSIAADSFSPLDTSVIWHLNDLFWKHFKLWEKTYGEHYEASLPSGVSESHNEEFIVKSAKKFILLLENLAKMNELPETIFVLEQGPGTGLYAKGFLDLIKSYSEKNNQPFYERMRYVLSDKSEAILETSLQNLSEHKSYIQTTKDADLSGFDGKFLFVRHSNLWDQLPAKIFSSHNNQLKELQVQPVLDKDLSKKLKEIGSKLMIDNIAQALKSRTIEKLIIEEPRIWKPLARALFLQSRWQPMSENDTRLRPYKKTIASLTQRHDGQEFIFNIEVLSNTKQLLKLVDWSRSGYIEILDVIVPDVSGFDKSRRPKKYDGSLGLPINGPMLQTFLGEQNKHVVFEKIKGLNHTVIIREPSLKSLLRDGRFVTIAEIAASKNQTKDEILNNANKLLEQNIDIIAFSDQALVKAEYFKLAELADLGVFQELPIGRVMPVLKARTKTKSEINDLTQSLEDQNIKNLFVVTGDPSGESVETKQTSLDVLPVASSHFFSGAVAHPQSDDIPNMEAKIKAGAQFFIMQATYNHDEWNEWVRAIKKQKVNKKVQIIAVVMPVVSRAMLEVVRDIKDVIVPASFGKEFDSLTKDEAWTKGIELAKLSITAYKESGIFSGIYIYSKSPQIIMELNDFTRTHLYLQK